MKQSAIAVRLLKQWLMLGTVLCLIMGKVYAAETEAELTNIQANSLANGKIQIDFTFNKPVLIPKSFKTKQPARIIVDFANTKKGFEQQSKFIPVGVLRSIEVVEANNRVRVVLSLKDSVNYRVTPGVNEDNKNHIYLTLSGTSPVNLEYTHDKFSANQWSQAHHEIKSIDFRRDEDSGGRVIATLSDASMGINVSQEGDKIVVEFIDTSIPQRLQRRMDVTDFGTPIQDISIIKRGGNVKMTVDTAGPFQHLAYQINDKFIVDVSPDKEEGPLGGDDDEPVYTGERLSLNFQDIQVRAVLQLLAEFTGTNIVASDSVKGNITLRLNNVPWDEALAIILRTQGLAQRKVGNVLMIAPSEEVAAREKEDLESKKEVKQLEPLTTELVQLNYAKAEAIASLLKDQSTSLLTTRGNVTTDTRTNTVLIQDTLDSVVRARELIERLDIPVKQVLIEARIVNVDTNFEKEIGVQFGITKPEHISGTLDGANTMQTNVLNGDNPLLNIPVVDRLNVNLPSVPDGAVPGSIGVALAKLGKGYLLDLELSALESEGMGELISSPRLVTANQQEAYIEQGEEIPYQEATSSGATSVEFKKAVLALRVTPQITPDGNVILDLKINQDRRSNEPEVLGVPAIATQQIETRVLVDNGQTIVLGGVYQQDKRSTITRIPFLGSLPLVGYLFRNTNDSNERTELLIFITPKIVEQTAIN